MRVARPLGESREAARHGSRPVHVVPPDRREADRQDGVHQPSGHEVPGKWHTALAACSASDEKKQ